MNKVILVGRIARPVEIKETLKGQKVVRNAIAIRLPFKNIYGKYDSAFIEFSLFDNNAEHFSKYVEKGDIVELIGRLSPKRKEIEGNKIYTNEIIVENIGLY